MNPTAVAALIGFFTGIILAGGYVIYQERRRQAKQQRVAVELAYKQSIGAGFFPSGIRGAKVSAHAGMLAESEDAQRQRMKREALGMVNAYPGRKG